MAKDFSAVEELYRQLIPEDFQSQLCIYVSGERVVDAAHGIDRDAIVPIYSVSKALSAFAFAKIVEEGLIDLDEKVGRYWPEFSSHGKSQVTVRQLLSHQAGLPDTRRRLTIEEVLSDHDAAQLLALEPPFWEPGIAFGYHGITIGNLMSEIVFRVTGMSIQKYFENQIRIPAGADSYLGLSKNLHDRFLPSLPPKEARVEAHQFSLNKHVFKTFIDAIETTPGKLSLFSPEGLEFGHPAGGGVGTARGVAEVFDWATGYGKDGGGIKTEVLEDFSRAQVYGYDLVGEWAYSSYGTVFMKPSVEKRFGSFRAFGHDGAAGALAFADPVGEVVFSYVVRRFSHIGGLDPRLGKIIAKVHEIIG